MSTKNTIQVLKDMLEDRREPSASNYDKVLKEQHALTEAIRLGEENEKLQNKVLHLEDISTATGKIIGFKDGRYIGTGEFYKSEDEIRLEAENQALKKQLEETTLKFVNSEIECSRLEKQLDLRTKDYGSETIGLTKQQTKEAVDKLLEEEEV